VIATSAAEVHFRYGCLFLSRREIFPENGACGRRKPGAGIAILNPLCLLMEEFEMKRELIILSLTAALATAALAACSSGGGNSSSSTTRTNSGAPAITIDEKDINSRTYKLKSNLNFGDADSDRFTMFDGKTEGVTYFYAFNHQRRLTKDEVSKAHSFCSVYVLANLSNRPEHFDFPAFGRLLKAQLAQSQTNSDVTFELQLQGSGFNSFFLKCKNVANTAEASQHIGQLLDIQ
jgi:hypothetical protein